jgi:hypothetical protein
MDLSMGLEGVAALIWTGGLIVLLIVVGLSRRARRHGGAYQAGVVGAMYDWQNRDKQEALKQIVDEKRTKRPSEHPDGRPESGTDPVD